MTGDNPITYILNEKKSEAAKEANAELEILRALAAGKNPLTGAVLPDDSCYQSAKVLRAMLSAVKALEKKTRVRTLPDKAGKSWSVEEEEELKKGFDQGMTLSDLARKHERTRGGIGARLERLGKIKLYVPTEQK